MSKEEKGAAAAATATAPTVRSGSSTREAYRIGEADATTLIRVIRDQQREIDRLQGIVAYYTAKELGKDWSI